MRQRIAMLLSCAGGLMAQRLELRPEVGEPVKVEKKLPQATVNTLERHREIVFANGKKTHVYRHDLTMPTLHLIQSSQDGAEFTYTYEIGNDKAAKEPINQVGFSQPRPDRELIYFTAEGIKPGEKATFSIKSKYGPGMMTAIVRNLDALKEAVWLERFHDSDLDQDEREAANVAPIKDMEVSVIGPSVKPVE